MKVVVDTSIWSLALRRRTPQADPTTTLLTRILDEGRVALLGAVRQEILSGIRNTEHFESLKMHLRAFPDMLLDAEDHETAADYFNTCRSHGIQGANTDFLICAAASRRDYSILTTDKDFVNFAEYLPIELVTVLSH